MYGVATKLSNTQAKNEAFADFMTESLFSGKNFNETMNKLQEAFEDKNAFQKFIDTIKDILSRIKEALGGSASVEALERNIVKLQREIDKGKTVQNKNTDNNNGVKYEINTNFANDIKTWDRNGKSDEESFILGSTGDVLQGLGARENDIYINGSKINTILRDHPEMSLDVIKKIPEILENPILVLSSKNKVKNNTRMVMFGRINAENGKPVLCVLDLIPKENKIVLDDMQKAVSAYSKTNGSEDIKSFFERSEVLYTSKNKKITNTLLRRAGFSMPTNPQFLGYIGSITYKGPYVNIKGKPFNEVFSYDTNNSISENAQNDTDIQQMNTGEDIDSEYMSAVENGDTDTAQRFVDEAAKQAGYTIKAYHGSPNKFNVFDKERLGSGNDQYGSGFYFSTNSDDASYYGKEKYSSVLKIKKPISLNGEQQGQSTFNYNFTPEQAYQILKKHPNIYDVDESPLGDFYDIWSEGIRDWHIREVAEQYTSLGDLEFTFFRNNLNEFHQAIKDVTGHDGVKVVFEDGSKDFYVAWDSNQIKSADPVVYDDNGNVIPLSERFDDSKSDIRFSIDDEVDNSNLSDYNDIRVSAKEYKLLESEAMTWDGGKKNQILGRTLSNGYTYRYYFDDDGILHITDKWVMENIHEKERNFNADGSRERFISSNERIENRQRFGDRNILRTDNKRSVRGNDRVSDNTAQERQGTDERRNQQSDDTNKAETRFKAGLDNSAFSVDEELAELNEKYGTIKKGANAERDIDVPKKTSDNMITSYTARSILEKGNIDGDALEKIKADVINEARSHRAYTDKQALDYAERHLKNGDAEDLWQQAVGGKAYYNILKLEF